jgi:hypothetical protein
MEELIKWGLFAAMAATVVVLVMGLVTLFKSGPHESGKSNRMMQLRVLFQAIALALFALLLYVRQG